MLRRLLARPLERRRDLWFDRACSHPLGSFEDERCMLLARVFELLAVVVRGSWR